MIEILISEKPINYTEAITVMEVKADALINHSSQKQLIWILEHNSVYTAGKSILLEENTINGVPIIKTNRGGEITCHNPKQIVVYFAYDMNYQTAKLNKITNIHDFIFKIESTITDFIKSNPNYHDDKMKIVSNYNNKRGIWIEVNDFLYKVGFIGLKVSKSIVTHGFSINIANDLSLFKEISICGVLDERVASFEKIGLNCDLELNKKILSDILIKNFSFNCIYSIVSES